MGLGLVEGPSLNRKCGAHLENLRYRHRLAIILSPPFICFLSSQTAYKDKPLTGTHIIDFLRPHISKPLFGFARQLRITIILTRSSNDAAAARSGFDEAIEAGSGGLKLHGLVVVKGLGQLDLTVFWVDDDDVHPFVVVAVVLFDAYSLVIYRYLYKVRSIRSSTLYFDYIDLLVILKIKIVHRIAKEAMTTSAYVFII